MAEDLGFGESLGVGMHGKRNRIGVSAGIAIAVAARVFQRDDEICVLCGEGFCGVEGLRIERADEPLKVDARILNGTDVVVGC